MKNKTTIIEKVINLLSNENEMTLKAIYGKLKEHTPASIRGNINRYLKSSKSPKIRRIGKGIYSMVEILTVEKIDKETNKVSYINRCSYNNQEIAYFHKDYITSEDMQVGIYEKTTEYKKNEYEKMINDFNSIQSVIAEGDCRTVLKRLKDESFDCILTDPAYKVISGGTSDKKGTCSGILSKNDGKIFEENSIKFEEWIPEAYRVLKTGGQAYFFTNFLNLQKLMDVCSKAGFKFHNLLVWKKNNATPNRWYMKNCEYILFCRKGKAKAINNKGSKTVLEYDNIIGKKIHETEKPYGLIEELMLNSAKKGSWVLDMFGGSMVANIVGLINNIKVFSIEKDKKYVIQGFNRVKNFIKTGQDRLVTE